MASRGPTPNSRLDMNLAARNAAGMEHLPEIGRLVLWQGAQPLRIDSG